MEGGVPEGARWTPVPDAFFSQILPAIADAATLKVALHVLWRVKRRPSGDPPALRFDDLANDTTLLRSLGLGLALAGSGPAANGEGGDVAGPGTAADDASGAEDESGRRVLEGCLARLVRLGWLIVGDAAGEGGSTRWIWPNVPESRKHYQRWRDGGVLLPEGATGRVPRPIERGDIFRLYEENLGVIGPLMAERLMEAEATYPAVWIEDAIRAAVEQNVRRWAYVSAILERWARDGRDDETDRSSGTEGRERSDQGPYADVVRH